MKDFVIDFVNNIAIGPMDNQVGIIIFNENARISFKLDTHKDKGSVLKAINNLDPLSNFTNVEDALCKLKEGYKDGNGARPLSSPVFRIAIILTDGKSNHNHSDCGWDTIEDAAKAVHNHSILVYVIAVGDFDDSELRKIASEVPGSIAHISDFDSLSGERDRTFDDMCIKGT